MLICELIFNPFKTAYLFKLECFSEKNVRKCLYLKKHVRVIHYIVGLAAKTVLGMKVKLVEVEGIKFMNNA